MATDNLMPQSSTSIIKHFMLRSSSTGQGLTGKVASDFTGKYNIAGGAEVTLSFSSGTAGDAYTSGKIVPLGLGKYAWHVPNAVFASLGNVSAVLSVTGGIDVHCEWLVVTDDRNLLTKPVNVTQFDGTNGTFASGRPEVRVASMADNTLTAASIAADAGAELAALVETYIVNEGDATAVMQAIANLIAADWVAGDASPLAIAAAVRTNLATELARIDAAISTRLAAAGYTAPANSDIAAIKAKADQLTFTTANKVDSTAVLDSATQTQINNIETRVEALPATVTVLPATGIVANRAAGTTLTPVVSETISQAITLYQSDGTTAVNLSGKTLRIIFETMSGVDVAVVQNASITVSGASSNVVTFAYPSAVTASERVLRFALRDEASPLTMYLQGVCSVVAAPKVDT